MNKMEQAQHDIRVKRGLVDPEPEEAKAEEPAAEAEPEAEGEDHAG